MPRRGGLWPWGQGWPRRHNRRTSQVPGRDTPVQHAAQTMRQWVAGLSAVFGVAMTLFIGEHAWQYLGRAEAFRLHHIEVRGAGRLSESEILAAAKISRGQPLLRLKLAERVTALLDHPWVERAQLRRHLPDHLHVEIVEQVPRALAMLDELWVVNPRGEVFKRFEAKDRVVLPVISGPALTKNQPTMLAPQLRQSLALIDHLDALRPGFLSVEALHQDPDLGSSAVLSYKTPSSVEMERTVVVHLGQRPQERSPQMLKTLDDLAQRARFPEEIWLNHTRAPERVAVRLSGSSAAEAEKSQSVGYARTVTRHKAPSAKPRRKVGP